MYLFGAYQYLIDDTTRDPAIYPATSGGGRLLYFDPNEVGGVKTIREFNYLAGFGIDATRIASSFNALGDLLSVAQGDDGELYGMFLSGDVKRLVGPPVGDFDKDFDVDGNDLNDLTKGWKARFDVDLTSQDFLLWQQHLGESLAATANGAAVPEPRSELLLAAMGLAAAAVSRPWGRYPRRARHGRRRVGPAAVLVEAVRQDAQARNVLVQVLQRAERRR